MAKTKKTAVRPTPAQRAARTKAEVAAADANATTKASAPPPTVTTARSAPAPDTRTAAELAKSQDLGQTLADHSLETHQAAAGMAQMQATGSDPVVTATGERVDAINAAVEARNAEARDLQERNAKDAEWRESARVENAAVPLGSVGAHEQALRVPAGVAQAPRATLAAGISPDVTSPVTGPVVQVPGTGVARLSELAPGQSLAPSPPISSSNILPQPDNPSFG